MKKNKYPCPNCTLVFGYQLNLYNHLRKDHLYPPDEARAIAFRKIKVKGLK